MKKDTKDILILLTLAVALITFAFIVEKIFYTGDEYCKDNDYLTSEYLQNTEPGWISCCKNVYVNHSGIKQCNIIEDTRYKDGN